MIDNPEHKKAPSQAVRQATGLIPETKLVEVPAKLRADPLSSRDGNAVPNHFIGELRTAVELK